jgi:K+-sensing histidine kinase KdpD
MSKQQVDDKNHKWRILLQFSETLVSGVRLREDDILKLIHTQARKLMDMENFYIALYDENTNIVRFGLAYVNGKRIDIKKDKSWQPRKAGKGKTEEIIRTKQPILHATKAEAKRWHEQPGHKEYVGAIFPSWMGVPIVVGNNVIGVIATYHPKQEYIYSRGDLDILQLIASQAAIALDNANLYYNVNQKLERRVVALAALIDISIELTSGIRLKEAEILKLICDQVQRLTSAQDMYIALYDGATGIIRFPLATQKSKLVEYPSHKANLEKHGKTERIIITRKPILQKTKKEAEAWYGQPGYEEKVGLIQPSWLGVPMMVGERVLGVIAVYDLEREYAYDEQDLEVLSLMASQAAIALDNVRLFEEARADAIANRQLATLGTAIAALQHRINNTLNIISPNVKRLRNHLSTENDPEVEEILGIIDRNTRYTSTLLNRIQTPLQEVGLINVDVNAILTDIFNRQKREWTARTPIEFNIQLKLDPNIPIIPLPIGQISEVFSNLIDNAYRALDKAYRNGETVKNSAKMVVVTKMDKGGTIKVQVIDNVPNGIPLPIRERLFDKPVPSRTPGEGSGLGLWLSKLILQRIGGNIRIEDTGPGGTTMLVEIPLPESQQHG